MGLVLGDVDKKETTMDVSYVLSDSVKVAIRQKDKSSYAELATETNIYLIISSDVWLKTDWVSELYHRLDTRVCVGYRKCVVRKPNGQILFLNSRNYLQLCFAISTMEWYKLQDLYASISHVLETLLTSVSNENNE